MTRFFSKVSNPLFSAPAITCALLLTAAHPQFAIAQTVSLTPAPIAEYNALVNDWQSKRDALETAMSELAAFEEQNVALTETAAAQQAKVDSAKQGLSSAVLKVSEAKKRLSQVDTSDEDPKGEELSNSLLQSQQNLNTVISSSETLQDNIKSMKEEHAKLRSTVEQLKNAAAAAQAAFSAAEVLVEAVKSAQAVISDGDDNPDLETDFFKDAVAQAENAKKSENAARDALAATRKRQIEVGDRLLKADEQLANAKQAETKAY